MSSSVFLQGGCLLEECFVLWGVALGIVLFDPLRIRKPEPLLGAVVAGGGDVCLLGLWFLLVGCGCLSGWRRLGPLFPLRGFVGNCGGRRQGKLAFAFVGFVDNLVEEVARFLLLSGVVRVDAHVPEVVGGSVCCVDHVRCGE